MKKLQTPEFYEPRHGQPTNLSKDHSCIQGRPQKVKTPHFAAPIEGYSTLSRAIGEGTFIIVRAPSCE